MCKRLALQIEERNEETGGCPSSGGAGRGGHSLTASLRGVLGAHRHPQCGFHTAAHESWDSTTLVRLKIHSGRKESGGIPSSFLHSKARSLPHLPRTVVHSLAPSSPGCLTPCRSSQCTHSEQVRVAGSPTRHACSCDPIGRRPCAAGGVTACTPSGLQLLQCVGGVPEVGAGSRQADVIVQEVLTWQLRGVLGRYGGKVFGGNIQLERYPPADVTMQEWEKIREG